MPWLTEESWENAHGLSEYEQMCWELEKRANERARTLMELEEQFGPRPRVAAVLRLIRMRRDGK